MTVEHPREDRIQDYVDDLLCAEERAEVEHHIVTCEQCLAEVAALRNMLAGLHELPGDILPARDLRNDINARIDDLATSVHSPGLRDTPGMHDRPRLHDRPLRTMRVQLAAAAVVLMAVSAAATLYFSRASAPVAEPAASPSAQAGSESVRLASSSIVEQRYRDAAAELERALDRQRTQLAPETIRIVEENLRVIDAALTEARAALREDPNNAALSDLLRSAYEKKLDLLRHATRGEI